MRIFVNSALSLSLSLAACIPKAGESESTSLSSDSSTTADTDAHPTDTSVGGDDAEWAMGRYYRPAYGEPTQTLATIEVRTDHVAVLSYQGCESTSDISTGMFEVGWEILDEDSIVFTSAGSSEQFLWFGFPPVGETVTLSKGGTVDTVVVTDDETVDNAYMGAFQRKDDPVCLVVVDTSLPCSDGKTVVLECPAP